MNSLSLAYPRMNIATDFADALIWRYAGESRLTIGGSDEEADDEKVDEVEFAELYKKLVHLGGKL